VVRGKCNIGLIWSLVLSGLLAVLPHRNEPSAPPVVAPNLQALPTVQLPQTEIVEGAIQKNTTLVATLVDFDVPTEIAHDVARLIEPVFDVRKIRFGNLFRLEKENDGTLKKFEYKIDDERVLRVEKNAESYTAQVDTLEFEVRPILVNAEIQSSLYEALDNTEKGEMLAVDLADIFSSDVDFNTEIQKGDRIRVVVNAQYHDGQFVKYAGIQAAELMNAGTTYRAFRFKDAYYDANGNSMKRAFLRSPLKFEPRITSGFSRARLHPILGQVRSHLAVDFGAPTGAPVVAVANGTVISAGWNGGYGRLVQIKHNNGLTTGYAHLSRIAGDVRPGRIVKQGDVIGLVGQTGLATGPHLHYMMTRGGMPINPLSIKSEPPAPIEASLKPEFLQQISTWDAMLKNGAVETAAK
jgi:murein DD-endopeptidase MepM/ murein hydrolase activator NlpD